MTDAEAVPLAARLLADGDQIGSLVGIGQPAREGRVDEVDPLDAVVSAQTATIQAAHVAETGATLLEFATPDETVAAVRNGESDAVFADYDFLKPIAEQSGGELMIVGEPVQLGKGIGLGLRESDTELKDKFDAAIASMKEDGSLNELLKKYFGEDTATY